MQKCFLGLWSGVLFGLAYVVSDVATHGEHWANAIPGALEWVFLGGLLTAIALTGYALYAAVRAVRIR